MQVVLTQELAELVQEQVASGRYQTGAEVVRDALQLLKERSEARARKLEALRREVQIGIDQLDRGEGIEFDVDHPETLLEEIKRRGRERMQR